MDKIKELVKSIAAKRTAIKEEFGKHPDNNMPEETLKKLEADVAQVEAEEAEVKRLEAVENLKAKNNDRLATISNTIINNPGFPSSASSADDNGSASGAAKVVGFADAGMTVFERKSAALRLAYQEGEGLMDAKLLATVSATPYKRAFKDYLRKGIHGLDGDAVKTLQEGTDSAGGFFVPDDIADFIISRLPTPARLASRVNSFETSSDNFVVNRVKYTADDIYTTGIRVKWTGEIPASATTHRVTDPVFGQIEIPIYTAMLSLPLTNNMIEDSSFPIVPFVSQKFAETIDILKDDMIINGSGLGQPSGILKNPGGTEEPAVVNSGNASALTADGIINLAFALPEQYDEQAVMVFNKTSTGKAIAGFKDTTNRYLWGAGLQDSGIVGSFKNRQLVGYDTILSALMPNVAANAFPIIFGDLRGYYQVNRVAFSIQVLRELYAETNQALLLGRVRLGGKVAEDFRIKVQKVSA